MGLVQQSRRLAAISGTIRPVTFVRAGDVVDKPGPHWVAEPDHDDRNGAGCGHRDLRGRGSADGDDVCFEAQNPASAGTVPWPSTDSGWRCSAPSHSRDRAGPGRIGRDMPKPSRLQALRKAVLWQASLSVITCSMFRNAMAPRSFSLDFTSAKGDAKRSSKQT
jgi:hypothetical protein